MNHDAQETDPPLERVLFDQAVQQPSAADRAAFLDRVCRDNPGLRTALEALLAMHFDHPEFLPGLNAGAANPNRADAALLPSQPAEAPQQRIGRYQLLEKIGEGGFGDVWMAEQREPVQRLVALKVLKPGMDSRQIVARFEAERQALAMMDHPNIAKIFDAGTTGEKAQVRMLNAERREGTAPRPDHGLPPSAFNLLPSVSGRPYFVMELVRGVKITEYCDQNQLPTPARLRLFIEVCKAVQHAHQKGVIHRDLKPSNILVTLHDGVPVPKVIDFGIAKAMRQELTDQTVFTQFNQFIGTPAYISPEQAEMSGLDIDTRADIYSLGVLLYELLVGQTPFDTREMLQGGLDSLRRTIREQEPQRPSTRFNTLQGEERTTAARRRQTDVARLAHQLEGDLDWIVMKCLEKDRTRRYDTANGLAMDIQRHLANEPVVARPPSMAYHLQKGWRRHRLAFSAAAAVALALVMGVGVSTWQAVRASRAEREQRRLSKKETQLRQEAEALEARARHAAYTSDMNLAQQALQMNNLGRASAILNRHRPNRGQSDLRGWEWRYLWRLCQSDALLTLCHRSNRVYSVAFSHQGQFLAVQDGSSEVSVWNLTTRQPVFSRRTGVPKQRIAFSPVTHQVAFAERGPNGQSQVVLWDLEQGLETRHWRISQNARELVFARDGKSLCALTDDEHTGSIFLWEIPSGRLILEAPAARDSKDEGNILALGNQGQTLAVGGLGGSVRWIDTATGQALRSWRVTEERTMALALLDGGGILASAGGFTDPIIRLWALGSGEELAPLKGHRSYINAMAVSPDGRLLATGSGDQTIRIWDWKERQCLQILRGHSEQVLDVAFSPDGQTVASGGKDGTVRLWRIEDKGQQPEYDLLPEAPYDWAFSPDSRLIVGVDGGIVRSWTTTNLEADTRYEALGSDLTSIAFSDDGTQFAVGTASGHVRLLQGHTGTEIQRMETGSGAVKVLGFSDRKSLLLTLHSNVVVTVWDLQSAQRQHLWSFPEGPWNIAMAGKTGVLVTRGPHALAAWRPTDGQRLWRRELPGFNPHRLSEDGTLVAVPNGEGFTVLFDARTGAEVGMFDGSLLGNHSAAFSPDSQRLAIGSDGMEAVTVWDTNLAQELLSLEGQGSGFRRTAFSPDGRLLGSQGEKGLHLWRAPTWDEIAAIEREANGEGFVQGDDVARSGESLTTQPRPITEKSLIGMEPPHRE